MYKTTATGKKVIARFALRMLRAFRFAAEAKRFFAVMRH